MTFIIEEKMQNINNNLIANLESYFQTTIEYLDKFKWVYDFQTTQLFTTKLFTHQFKQEWIDYFNQLNLDELKQLFTHFTSNNIPESLQSFLNESKRLLSLQEHLLDKTSNLKKNQSKKQHEIEQMLPFIRDLCLKHKCKYIIDIGSGLGYFGRLLANELPDLTIIAIEKNEKFQQEATKRNLNSKIINVSHTIDEKSHLNLMNQIRSILNEPDGSQPSMGLISLHSCGDLTPNMLKIFAQNRNELKFMAAFSCCYQALQPLSQSDSHSAKNEFYNFPMSKFLKQHDSFSLNLFALRLACQPNISNWLSKTNKEHEEHLKQVAYRGVVEKYCEENKLTMTKLKRKLVSLSEFNTFKTYFDYLNERVEFNDKENVKKQIDFTHLNECYSNVEVYFKLIEPLTALQAVMQPILEYFLLNDRLAYLFENNLFNSKLVKLFDSNISPRCVCILSERDE